MSEIREQASSATEEQSLDFEAVAFEPEESEVDPDPGDPDYPIEGE